MQMPLSLLQTPWKVCPWTADLEEGYGEVGAESKRGEDQSWSVVQALTNYRAQGSSNVPFAALV